MIYINKITANSVVDYAAEELRKYLRMMMPDGGAVEIRYNPEAKDGYRLGLMQDFGLDTSDVADTELDDILYVDTKGREGIIAGSNPRSVLIAVYEYFKRNGCRWLMPGVDGEYIPTKDVADTSFRHVPSLRYRGWVTEGQIIQQHMMDAIEFAPKLGMNLFMIEFRYPKSYYQRAYAHQHNEMHRPPEPINEATILQWERALETEIAKRGLQFHHMGHGFTYEPLGIDAGDGWNTEYESQLSDEQRSLIAMMDGERKIKYYPINTNLCMSNPKARRKVVDFAVDFAKTHENVDYLHIWLADANNNHCECEECTKKRPTDWYVTMLNEIDEAYTAEGIKTRLVFIAYMDSAWAPLYERIKNPDRFLIMLAPITRRYDMTLPPEGVTVKPEPFVLNKLKMPTTLEQFFAHLAEWREKFDGKGISFEYHFWRAFYNDITGLRLARLLVDDVRTYKEYGIDGILEDGTQRCFFPTGITLYTYARSMFDMSLSYEDIVEEYFECAFGEAWRKFYDIFLKLDEAFDYQFMVRRKSIDVRVSTLYNPEHAKSLEKVKEITERLRALIKEHYNADYRVGTVSVRLLEYYAEYCDLLADAYIPKAQGNDALALERFNHLVERMGRHEVAIEKYFDHTLMTNALRVVFVNMVTHNEYMDV